MRSSHREVFRRTPAWLHPNFYFFQRINALIFAQTFNVTSTIQLSQTRMKIHHASSIRPIKDKLFKDEKTITHSGYSASNMHLGGIDESLG
jgi:hypothetical protein